MSATKEPKVSGFKELFYVVRQGDTVSGVAAHYRAQGWPVKGWQPIYDATRLKTGLWDRKGTKRQRYNPDLIYPGDVLIIPRSVAGYDRRIAQLEALAREVMDSDNEAAKIRQKAQDFGEKIDLLSDVLQLVVTCGLSAAKAVKAAKAAKGATGLKLTEHMIAKHQAMADLFKEISIFSGTKAAELIDSKAGVAAKLGTKTAPKAYKLVTDGALKAVKGIKAVGLSIARGADIILDFVNPSTLAKLYIYARTGEKVDDTLFQAEYKEMQLKTKTLELLADRVVALRAEKAFLYEGGEPPDRDGVQ